MKIAFFYECGKIKEVGTGHKYRAKEIGELLERNGHDVEYTEQDVVMSNWDVLVIDHIKSCKDMIGRAKNSGAKVVLVDGHPDDVPLVDISISAFYNPISQYRGVKYIVIPTNPYWDKYRAYTSSKTIFVGVGGFDANDIAEFILNVLDDMNLNAIVTKSINHGNFRDNFSNVEIFDEDNYYDAMHECVMGITNGGLTFFQALYYGLPTVAVPQYEHQQTNIDYLQHCCLPAQLDKDDIVEKIGWLIDNEYHRKSLSTLSTHYVDGKGTRRICNLIEGLK